MQVSDEEPPSSRQIRFTLPSEERSSTPESDEESDSLTRSTARRSIAAVTPRKGLLRKSRLVSTTLSKTFSEEKSVTITNMDAGSTWVTHDEEEYKDKETRSSFYLTEQSQEVTVTPELEEVTGPVTSRLASVTFKSSSSGESNKIVSSQDANLSSTSHDTTKPLEEETESASVENDSDPFYSLENSATGMSENIESPLKKQKVSSSDRDKMEEQPVTGEKPAVDYVEKDNNTDVKEKFVSVETTIKTTEITLPGTDDIEGDMDDVQEVDSSLTEKSQGGILGDWSSFEVSYGENAMDNSTGVIEENENVPEVAASSVEVSFTSLNKCEVQRQEPTYDASERTSTVEPSDMQQTIEEEYVDRREEGDTSGSTYLEGNDSKTEDASSPEIIQEEKMSHGILIDTSTCSLYFENSTEEVDESQTENQAENFPTLIIESVCGNEGISPSSEDDQKDFQTLQPMAMMPVEELNVDNEMEDFDFVRQRVERRKSNDDESIILLDSEDDIVEQPKLVELETKMSDPEESEGENTDMDEEGNEEEEDVKYVSELKKSPQKECAPEDEQKELSVSMTDNDDSVAVRDANVLVNVSVELPNSSDEEDVQVKESVSKIEIVEIFEKVDVEITQAKDKAEETIKTKDSDSSVVETNTDETNNSCVTNSNKCDVQKRDKMDSDRLDLNKDIPENLANEEMDFEACISFSEISKTGSSLLKTGENLTQSMDVDNDVMDFESEIATNQISKSKLAEVSHKEISVTESGEARNTVSGSVSHFVGEESMEVQQSINETLKDTKDKADKSSSLAENTGEMTNVRAGSVPPVEVPCKNEFNVERNIFRGRSAPPEDVSPTKRKIRKSRYEVESVVEQRDVILNLNTKLASTKAVDKDKYSSQDIKACDKAEQIKRSRLDVTGEETGTKETRCDFNILYKQDSREDLQASQTRAGSLPPENVSKPKLRRSRRSSSVQPEDLMIERVAYGTEDLQRKDTVEKKAKKTNRKAMNEGDKTENIATVDGAVQPQDIVVNKIENQTHEVMGRDEIERKQNISSKEIKDQNPAEVSTSVPSEDVLLEVTCTKSLKSGSRANSVPIVDQPVDDTEGTPKPGKKQHFIACENLPADETKKETHKPGRRSCSVPPKDPHISEVGKRAYECERKGTSIPPDNYSMSDTGRQQSSKDSVAHENLPETKKRTSKSRRRAYSLPSVACYKSDQGIDDSRPLDFVEIEPTKSRNASTSRQSSKPGCSSELTEPVRGNEGHIDDIPHKLSSTANTGAHEVTSDIVESDGERPPSVSSQASTIHLEHSRTTRSRRSSVSSQCSSSQDEGMEVEASKVRSTRSRRSGFVQRDAKLHVVYEEPEETHSAVNKMDIVVGSEKNSQGTRGRRVSESRAGDSEVIHEQGNRTRSEAGSEHSLQIQRNRGSVSEAGSVSEVSVVRTLRSGKVYSESEEDTRSPKSGRFVARQRVRADSTSGGDTVSSQQVMEEYATARRLTRYQKLLLERSMEHATPPASQPTSYGRLPALSETSDDEELETSSVGTRSSSRLSAQRVAAVGTSPESSQTSTLQGTPQRPQRLTRRSLSRLKDKVTESPGSVKSDASTVYASSVASCPADTSPTSIHSEDILGSRTRRRSFQKAMHTFKSSSEKGYPMCKGNSPGVSDKDSEADSIQSDSNFIRTRSCAVQLSKVLESDLSSPSSFHFSPPTVLPGGGRKEATSLPVPAFVFSPPQKQQPHPKVHRSNVTSQQTRAHTMALRSLHSISEESSPSTSSSSYLTKSSERDTTPIAVKRSKKFKDSPKPSSPSLSKITPLTEEEKRELAKRVSRRFYCPDTKRMYSAFKQRKVYKLRSNSKSRP
ncbi:hypothetical protein C0J52_11431 [Blattella germanica]|nr:hypothetical protein C0J52_11431 [Blattella germanica]